MEQGTTESVKQNDIKPSLTNGGTSTVSDGPKTKSRQRSRRKHDDEDDPSKRRCVSTACIACRKRKSKCDGNLPACAACSQVYGTECVYDPNSDHRRKGVYKNDLDNSKTRNSTLQTLIQSLLNLQEDEAFDLVRDMRSCESLDAVAEQLVAKEHGVLLEDEEEESPPTTNGVHEAPTFERKLYGNMGDLRLDEGSVRYIGGTSNLIHIKQEDGVNGMDEADEYTQQEDPITSWTRVTDDPELVVHLLNMYFTWHYTYFTTLSKTLFYRDFMLGRPPPDTRRKTHYCTPLLVNAILALGCHFTSRPGARANPEDSATAGDHFFKEAKRLILENDEHERPRLTTVQALALMSVREAGCGREAKGWVYSGMSFRMASDMGLNLNTGQLAKNKLVHSDDAEEDCRRITFWGCFLFDKCWSNYLGRLPQLPTSMVTVPKPEVFPDEDSAQWSPYTDSGFSQAHSQPARTRAVALQISKLCEISNDLINYFYNPSDMERNRSKSAELKMLSSIHTRLEAWRRDLPKEMEPREGGLSSILVMHMFFQLLFVHLFRPFLKYTQATSPLPQTVSPRKLCTQAAAMISKLMRLYKRSHGLRQICNIAVYIAHSACTIHLLNLPDKNARRDIVHGVKHLEEIADGWLCARRTLGVLSALSRKWKVELPEEAAVVLARTDRKFGSYRGDVQVPSASRRSPAAQMNEGQFATQQSWQNPATIPTATSYFGKAPVLSANGAAPQSDRAPTVRSNSDSYSIPPYDANGLHPKQYPSASTTPQAQQRSSVDSYNATSPSDMFGGVEQLIRDSAEWVYRDQAQYATGFENWTGMDMDPSTWANGLVGDAGVNGGGAVAGAMTTGMGMPSGQPSAYATNTSPTSYPMIDWTSSGMPQPNHIATYNEDEWYQ